MFETSEAKNNKSLSKQQGLQHRRTPVKIREKILYLITMVYKAKISHPRRDITEQPIKWEVNHSYASTVQQLRKRLAQYNKAETVSFL